MFYDLRFFPAAQTLNKPLIHFVAMKTPCTESSRNPMSPLVLWIWLCAYLNCAGWVLSALHELNPTGYAGALVVGLGILLLWKHQRGISFCSKFYYPRWQRRFRRGFPLAFLILTVLAVLGGILYAPTNYDALAYRLPRILHWLAAGQWHWIHTAFERLNTRAPGMEWVSTPIIALGKSDRPLFLINVISFLFLPGLIFSLFTRLGVRPRVAWHWMWILPTGYGYLLQVGSIGNDMFGAVFVLAAVDFALRARTSDSLADFSASVLAASLMLGSKFGNLPLLLPWAAAIFPASQLVWRRPLRGAGLAVVAIFSSGFPIIWFNQIYIHDWSGVGMAKTGTLGLVVFRAVANVILLLIQNLVPPAFPFNHAWHGFIHAIMPPALDQGMRQSFVETGAIEFNLPETQMEESAGLGFGVCVLLAFSLAAVVWNRKLQLRRVPWSIRAVRWAAFLCFAAVLMKSQFAALARLLVPYYALVVPLLLLHPAQANICRRRWWRISAGVVFVLAGLLLVTSPARPLFPAAWVLRHAEHLPPRVREVYAVYADRNDCFAPVRPLLPADLQVLGYFSYDSPETSLWRPFGGLRVAHVCPEDTLADLKKRGIEYVLAPPAGFEEWIHQPLADWVAKMHGRVIRKIDLRLRVSGNLGEWWLIQIDAEKKPG
jgi:hypothetical protein